MPTMGIGKGRRAVAAGPTIRGLFATGRRGPYGPYRALGGLLLAGMASLLCGLFLSAQAFVLCGGVAVVMGIGVLWPGMSLRGLAGSLAYDRTEMWEGETVGVRLTLRNRLPWGAWGLAVKDDLRFEGAVPSEGDGKGDGLMAGISLAPGLRTTICRWEFKPTRRGIYPLATPLLTTGFPFGLWESRRALQVARPLIVWPRTYSVGPIPPVSGARLVEGNVSRSQVGTHGDVMGVRPYRRGDSPRRIHWRQSARQDRLIVCELESNSRPVIQIVLDTDVRVHVGCGPDSSREWSLRLVASLAKGWLEEGALVGVAWGGHEISPASGQSQSRKILDALAGLPDSTTLPLREVLSCPTCRGGRDGLQVIVTTDLTQFHRGCGTCERENQRWVVLESRGFGGNIEASRGYCPTPWVRVDSPERVPVILRGGWREAQHGS